MKYDFRANFTKQRVEIDCSNIRLYKLNTSCVKIVLDIFELPRAQVIDDNHLVTFIHKQVHQMRTNKASTTCNYSLHLPFSSHPNIDIDSTFEF
ncbi:hypothetical protein HMPREF2734_01320 [Corynebacterium sp. HMSC055D05]|nr:hypothetical protein HMPREF2734_01320 [Corynebacterium sp. HMSC055D05]